MPACEIAGFTIGQLTTDPSAAGLLGREIQLILNPVYTTVTIPGGETVVKLVKASTTISCTPGQVLLWDATTGSTTNQVGSLAGAAAVSGTVAGFALLPIGTTSITSGSYLWVARRGPTIAAYGAAAVAQTALATVATGNVDDTGATFDTKIAVSFGTVSGAGLGVAYALLS